MACEQIFFFFKIINDIPQGSRQIGEQTSANLEAGQLSMPSYTRSAPRLPGSQSPPDRLEDTSLFLSVVLTGWFSAFLSSCMEELGLPLVCSSCNTSFKVTYLAKSIISFNISFHPAIIAG